MLEELKTAFDLIEGALLRANRANERPHDDATNCQYANAIRAQFDLFRLCSECHKPVGFAADVCEECYPSYQARLEVEDKEAEYRELEETLDDLEDDGYEDEDDGFDDGPEDERDWEHEALALEEARRDAEVDPFERAYGYPYDDGQDAPWPDEL